MDPYISLVARVENLKDVIPAADLMKEADVLYENLHNWSKPIPQSKTVSRWIKMLKTVGVDYNKVSPGESSYILIKKNLLTRDAVAMLFLQVGYSVQTARIWEDKGDPRQIESFKKVNQVIRKYEQKLLQEQAA